MSCGAPSHDPAYRRADNANHYATHREQRLESNARWDKEHPEQRQAYDAAYRANNPTKVRARKAKYCVEHSEAIRTYSARWSREHRVQKRAITTNYTHRRRANGGNFSRAAWEHVKALYGHCCAYCGKLTKRLTQDHVVPISKGGWHFSGNIVPACQSCNSYKGTSI